jgi:cell division septation protein DedD
MMDCRTSTPRRRTVAPFFPGAAILYVMLFSPVAEAGVSDEVHVLLCKGDFSSARALAEKAHAENPADWELALLYGRSLADADTALALYKKIARNKSAPDSIRSQSYFLLGCAAYLRGNIPKASGYFANAQGASGGACSIDARARNAILNPADSVSLKALEEQAADTVSGAGTMANFYLGIFYYVHKDFVRALSRFTTATSLSDSVPWACPAYAGAYVCAASLSRSQEAAAILAHIKSVFASYLEHSMVVTAASRKLVAKKDSLSVKETTAWLPADSSAPKPPSAPAPAGAPGKTVFSLQVGAFATLENAHTLKTGLARQFSSVTITTGSAGNKPVFRVRVGAFESRESAQAFGDSALTKKGMSFRIVEETPAH